MQATAVPYREMRSTEPDLDALSVTYKELVRDLGDAPDAAARSEVIQRWETCRRQVVTWFCLAHLRFNQDTTNPDYRAERERADTLQPAFQDLELHLKEAVLGSPAREEFLATFQAQQAFDLWERDAASFDPALQDELVEEQRLASRYIELLGGARIEFEGRKQGVSGLSGFLSDAQRDRREAAYRALWGWFDAQRSSLDGIFDELVTLRTRIARALGRPSFVEVGYDRKRRVDYDRADVEGFRQQVLEQVVPLGRRLVEGQARTLGLERVMHWDEKVHRPAGAPSPRGDAEWMTGQAITMFDSMDRELADFYRLMVRNDLLDLETRDGKAVGGFCTWLPEFGVPFIFANFNGTPGDVRVFTHEMGHAFQRYSSRHMALSDYVGCTSESAEVHSMSLEFLSWPEMERFFGDDAEDFRHQHLVEQLLFLPYGVAVDHFQHRIYEEPDLSPADRHAVWKELEELYVPWRDSGDVPHASMGGYWQSQRHVYAYPFYYIDYTLAATCALQFWARSLTDRAGAMKAYTALCSKGGSMPFQQLVASAGLRSPFEPGCLSEVVGKAADWLATSGRV